MFSTILSRFRNSWNYQTTSLQKQQEVDIKNTDASGKATKSCEPRAKISWADYVVDPLDNLSPAKILGTDIDYPSDGETDIDAVCAPVKPMSSDSDQECMCAYFNTMKRNVTMPKHGYPEGTTGHSISPFTLQNQSPQTLNHFVIPVLSMADIKLKRDNRGSLVVLGKGTYGTAYRAHMNNSTVQVVLKKISLSSMTRQDVYAEAKILVHLEPTGVVPVLHGIVEYSMTSVCIVQELCADGVTLKHIASHQFFSFTQYQWLIICYEITLALLAIHERSVFHNDVKADNILVNVKGSGVRVHMIDFGLATYKASSCCDLSPGYLKNFRYIAPEVRKCGPTSEASDIYSLGYVFYSLNEKGLKVIKDVGSTCLAQEPRKRPCLIVVAMEIEDLLAECEDWGNEST